MTANSENSLHEHLLKEHKQSPFSEYLREIVYGGVDGIVTTFAVVAGFSGAQLAGDTTLSLSFLTVLLFGLANLFADGLSMGLGNFLSIRAEQDVYKVHKNKERKEIKVNTAAEKAETVQILVDKGFDSEDAQKLTEIYMKNEEYWVDWMMNHELEMPNPEGTNPFFTGLATLLAFVIFGFIPLIPFIVLSTNAYVAFVWSSIGAVIALTLLGLLKGRVIGGGLIRSVLEVVIIGGTSAVVAFLVGSFFSI